MRRPSPDGWQCVRCGRGGSGDNRALSRWCGLRAPGTPKLRKHSVRRRRELHARLPPAGAGPSRPCASEGSISCSAQIALVGCDAPRLASPHGPQWRWSVARARRAALAGARSLCAPGKVLLGRNYGSPGLGPWAAWAHVIWGPKSGARIAQNVSLGSERSRLGLGRTLVCPAPMSARKSR